MYGRSRKRRGRGEEGRGGDPIKVPDRKADSVVFFLPSLHLNVYRLYRYFSIYLNTLLSFYLSSYIFMSVRLCFCVYVCASMDVYVNLFSLLVFLSGSLNVSLHSLIFTHTTILLSIPICFYIFTLLFI